MRRISIAIVITTLFLLIPSIKISKPFTGVSLHQVSSKETNLLLANLQNYDILEDLVVIPAEVEDKDALGNMLNTIDHIERNLLVLLKREGVVIRLFEGNLTDEPLLYFLKWQKPRGWKQGVTWEQVPGSGGSWLISAKIGASNPGNGHGSVNLELHEIGHTLYNLLSPEKQTEFNAVWNSEVQHLFPGKPYYSSYPSEYFSESFAHFYINLSTAGKLSTSAPRTYSFIKEMSQNLEYFRD